MDRYTTVKAPESMSQALQQVEDPFIFKDPEATWIGKTTENKELTGETWSFSLARGCQQLEIQM